MIESKLIFLLKTFKKIEWRRFKEFLASPYFNKRSDLIAFFDYISSVAPNFSEKKLAKAVVFKKLYANQRYDDKQMRYLMNYTLKAAEQFLGQQRLESLTLTDNAILEELVDRKLEKHSRKYFEKIELNQQNVLEKSIDFYYSKFKLADTALKYSTYQDLREDKGKLKLAADNLDSFYFYNKLRYSCGMLNRQQLFATSYDLTFTDLINNYLKEHEEKKVPMIAIYAELYAMLAKEEATENFKKLKELIQTHNQEIPIEEKKLIYLNAINYCSQQIKYNNNSKYYVNQCLDLYMEGIQQEFLFINGYLSPWYFKNVVKLGINLKKYDWTQQFIQDYHKKLTPEFQQDALHYNLADLAYRKEDYGQSQYHLLLVEYSDVVYSLGAKTMLLKIYYENAEFESLFSLIASFSIYLRRNKKISENYRETYMNFTTLLHQVLRAKKSKIPALTEKIRNTELVTNRNWLLKICNELYS